MSYPKVLLLYMNVGNCTSRNSPKKWGTIADRGGKTIENP